MKLQSEYIALSMLVQTAMQEEPMMASLDLHIDCLWGVFSYATDQIKNIIYNLLSFRLKQSRMEKSLCMVGDGFLDFARNDPFNS